MRFIDVSLFSFADLVLQAAMNWTSVGSRQRVYTSGTITPGDSTLYKSKHNTFTFSVAESELLPVQY